MPSYLRPDVYIEEVRQEERPLVGVGTAITGFLGVTKRGPVSQPMFITGVADFESAFGGPILGEALHYAITAFFRNGGTGAWIKRLAHYTNPASIATLVASTAFKMLAGRGYSAQAAFLGNVAVATFAANAGDDLVFAVNGEADDTVTLAAVAATITGVGGTFAIGTANTTADVVINGGPTQSVNLNGIAGTIADHINALNAQLSGVSVELDGGQIKITSDLVGSASTIALSNFGADFAAITGLTAASTASLGPNNVADVSAVTFAEIKAMIEAEVQDAVAGDRLVVTQTAAGLINLQVTDTSALGAASSLILQPATTTTLRASLGLVALGTIVNGSASASANALKVWAGIRGEVSPGLRGNDYKAEVIANPLHPSTAAGSDLASDAASGQATMVLTSMVGIAVGSYLRLEEGGTEEYVEVLGAVTSMTGAVVAHTITLTANLVNSYTALAAVIESVEFDLNVYDGTTLIESFAQLSMNPDLDNYAETIINDELAGSLRIMVTDQDATFPQNLVAAAVVSAFAGGTSEVTSMNDADVAGDADAKTGLYGFDQASDLNLLVVPPSFSGVTTVQANAQVHNAMLDYAATRMDCFAILDAPAGLTPTLVKAYRQATMGADSMWGALYYPHVKVRDPLGLGVRPSVTLPPSGLLAGLYARVDAIDPPDGGVHAAPAGIGVFGKLKGVIEVEYAVNDREQDVLNPIGINCIRQFSRGAPGAPAPGVVVFGARTLSSNVLFRYIQVRRMLTFIEQTVRLGSRWAIFRNNDAKTWGRLSNKIDAFLRRLFRRGQILGASESEAWFTKVDGETTTPEHQRDGILAGEIGVSLIRPAEYVVFRFSQMQSGSRVSE